MAQNKARWLCMVVLLWIAASRVVFSSPTSRPSTQPATSPKKPSTTKPTSQRLVPKASQHTLAKHLFRRHGCWLCHSLDGTDGLGPTLAGIYLKFATLRNGKKIRRTKSYFRNKIRDSSSLELKGNRNNMPIYKDGLKPYELEALVTWLITIPAKPSPPSTSRRAQPKKQR